MQPGAKSPRPGSPALPSGPENAGQKGQKSLSQRRPESRTGGRPRGLWGSMGGGTPAAGQTRPSGRPGKQTQRPPKTTGSDGPPRRKYRGIPPPQPARQSARPALKIPPRTSSRPPEHAAARREEGPVMARAPGAPTRPAGAGKRKRPPPARGSPTSSVRRNQTASSRPRRKDAPASPQTSRRGHYSMSPGPRPSGPTGLPSAPGGTGTSPTREPPPPGTPAPREPRSRPPRTRVHRGRPPAGNRTPPGGTPHHLDDPVHPRSRIGIGPEHQLLPEKPVAGQRNPDPGRPAGTTPGTAASGTGMFTSPP